MGVGKELSSKKKKITDSLSTQNFGQCCSPSFLLAERNEFFIFEIWFAFLIPPLKAFCNTKVVNLLKTLGGFVAFVSEVTQPYIVDDDNFKRLNTPGNLQKELQFCQHLYPGAIRLCQAADLQKLNVWHLHPEVCDDAATVAK